VRHDAEPARSQVKPPVVSRSGVDAARTRRRHFHHVFPQFEYQLQPGDRCGDVDRAARTVILTGASDRSPRNGAFMASGVRHGDLVQSSRDHADLPHTLDRRGCGALVGLLLGLPATRLRGPYLAGMTWRSPLRSRSSSVHSAPGPAGIPVCSCRPKRRLPDGSTVLHAGTCRSRPPRSTSPTLPSSSRRRLFFMANLFASRTGRSDAPHSRQ